MVLSSGFSDWMSGDAAERDDGKHLAALRVSARYGGMVLSRIPFDAARDSDGLQITEVRRTQESDSAMRRVR
jgi:hypothetical protein